VHRSAHRPRVRPGVPQPAAITRSSVSQVAPSGSPRRRSGLPPGPPAPALSRGCFPGVPVPARRSPCFPGLSKGLDNGWAMVAVRCPPRPDQSQTDVRSQTHPATFYRQMGYPLATDRSSLDPTQLPATSGRSRPRDRLDQSRSQHATHHQTLVSTSPQTGPVPHSGPVPDTSNHSPPADGRPPGNRVVEPRSHPTSYN
jgi:hypothetical protein